ncbi:chorismate-binding protein [Phycisphaera mikurensis]|uniref:Anthranilate synthase component I n=1 Tax=Phycisphaera mikurensis (strain NBRC 102666 / KCTC 22515 / FYK2301M01) TaxID=1142394 RepID=I0IB05_PHYMF|nr:chorismate-binding protein [Phycisphaera mikurensis]MBB6442585.1 anthranilate synthase component 1 [Phycisphaera mikurensis]BAM02443.1 anthranilate synthase component I [Phycisphaera mikurensis NBRC 102666]
MTATCQPDAEAFEAAAAAARGRTPGVALRLPVVRRLLGDALTPVLAYRRLVRGERRLAPSFLLDSVTGGDTVGRYSFLGSRPVAEVIARGPVLEVRDHAAGTSASRPCDDPLRAMPALTRQLAPGRWVAPAGLPPFAGGWVGYAGYDTVRYTEPDALGPGPPDDRDLPDLHFQLYPELVAFDHAEGTLLLIGSAALPADRDASEAFSAAVRGLDALQERLLGGEPEPVATPPRHAAGRRGGHAAPDLGPSSLGAGGYQDAVRRVKEYVAAGDAFQVVPSQRFEVETAADPFDVYRALRAVNPSPYLFYLQAGGAVLVGSSPEILVKVVGGVAASRPLAGTRPRGRDAAEDDELSAQLRADPKDTAEHSMLVDLHRNDIGRVAEPGSVGLTELMAVERYSHVMHLSSEVRGRLREGVDAWEALRVSLPVGTVSGAPKVRAMQIIDELEPVKRGPYGGAVGHAGFNGDLDTCIALRTMVVLPPRRRGGPWRVHLQAGGGVVADSDPDAEHQETLNKAAGLLEAVRLAERLFGGSDPPPADDPAA